MSADLIERLRKRAKEDQMCADNSAVIVEALAEQMKRFDDRDEKRPWNTYAVRMAVDHRNSVRRDAQFAADLIEAADALAAKDAALSEMRAERDALLRRINSPETENWMAGVPLEAAHQIERWGADHDVGKTAWDWFWLIGYLSQKAATSQAAGDLLKAKHHTISTAAALLNWHRHLTGENTAMRPGIDPIARGVEAARAASQDDGEERCVTLRAAVEWMISRERSRWDKSESADVYFREANKIPLSALAISAADGWQSIETAPKDGRSVLLFTHWAGDEVSPDQFDEVQIGYWDAGNLTGDIWHREPGWSCDRIGEATHWQSLPSPPATNPHEGG